MTKNFTFIDLFSGIGGFRIALEQAGGRCVGFSEIDKPAIATYTNNFDTSHEAKLGDITQCQSFPKADLIVGGVPCQSWSIAGKNRGFNDDRGQLWFDSVRAVEQVKPKAFIFENVKGLQDPRNIDSLNLILDSFKNLGYVVNHQVLNAFDFGLPQNRERVFIVGVRKDLARGRAFAFPNKKIKKPKLYKILDGVEFEREHLEQKKFSAVDLFGSDRIPASRNKFQKHDELNNFFIFCDTRNGHSTIHSWDLCKTTKAEQSICMLILKNRRKSIYGDRDGNPISFADLKKLDKKLELKTLKSLIKKNILRKTEDNKYDLVNSKNSAGVNGIYRVYLPDSEIFSTLTATGTKDYVATRSIPKLPPDEYREYFIKNIINQNHYRQITSREAARLQGFPESFKIHPSYKLALKQFGNSVPVTVISALAYELQAQGFITRAEASTRQRSASSERQLELGL